MVMRSSGDNAVKPGGLARRVLLLLMAVAMLLPLVLSGQVASAATTSISCGNELLCEVVDEGSLTARITKFNPNASTGSDIEIPATWQNGGKTYTITEIGDSVFAGQQLTAVKFADGSKIAKLGASVFKSNGFTSISLPSSVVSLGSNAFEACAQLTSIDLSATGVTVIPDYAFWNCSGLTSVKLNDQTTSVGAIAFFNAPVERLEVPSTIQSIGNEALYNGPRRVVINHVPDASIVKGSLANPAGVVEWKALGDAEVDKSCFWFDKTTGTVLGLKGSGHEGCEHADYHQANASLVIPARIGNTDVTAIGTGVFCDSHSGNIVGLSFEDNSNVTRIDANAFQLCSNLASLSLPDSLESIDSRAFDSVGVSTVRIPASVTTVGTGAFAGCGSLSKVVFEKDVNDDSAISSIGADAFYVNGSRLTEIDISGKTKDSVSGAPWAAQYAAVKWKDYTDDPQIVAVKGEDDSDWLYNTVTEKLVSYKGADGESSTDLKVPSKVTWTGADSKSHEAVPTGIGDQAVYNRGSFKSVTVPGNITSIAAVVFQDTQIGTLTLEEGVKTIDGNSFKNCALTAVSLPQSLTSIADQAFANNKLTSITIPRNVSSIAANAFSDNSGLATISVDQCRLVSLNGYPLASDGVKNSQPWSTDVDAATRISVSYKDDAMPLIVPDTDANRAISVGGESGLGSDMSKAVRVDATANTASVYVLSRMNYKGSSVKLDSLVADGQDATGGKSQTDSQEWLAGSKTGITSNGTVTFVSSFTDGGKSGSSTVPVSVDAFHTVSYDVNAPSGESVTGQPPADSTGYVEGYQVTVLDGSNMYVGLSKDAARYEFDGWNTQADGNGTTYQAEETMSMPNKDTTLYAMWKRVGDVSFTLDANDGMFDDTASKTQVTAKGEPGASLTTATGYQEPTRAGYAFKGWAESADSTDPSTMIPIEDGRAFYAVWQQADVTVTFDANGGKLTDNKSTAGSTGKYGDTLTVPAEPTRAGYGFAGWYTDLSDESTKLDTKNAKYPASATTYLAKWDAKDNEVRFDAGTDGTTQIPASLKVKTDATVSTATGFVRPDVTVNAGKRFLGWQSSVDGGLYQPDRIGNLTVTKDVTFTAVYEDAPAGSVTVLFDYAGGRGADGKSYAVSTGKSGDTYTTPANPTREGYTFQKWDPTPSGKYETTQTFTALWKANQYNITYDTKGGTLPADAPQKHTYGDETKLPTPTRDGYTFDGWTDETGKKVTTIPADAKDAKVTAQWTKNADKDGGNGGNNGGATFDPDGGTMPDGWTGEDGKLPIPTRPGYKFDGWYDEDGNLVTTIEQAAGKKLHAKWTPLSDAFDPNGGTMPSGWTGADGSLPVPTRDGYRFDGWYDEDGNLIATLEQSFGKRLHARWAKLDVLASTGAAGLAAGLTALALAGAGVAIGAVRRRRSR